MMLVPLMSRSRSIGSCRAILTVRMPLVISSMPLMYWIDASCIFSWASFTRSATWFITQMMKGNTISAVEKRYGFL